MRRIRFFFFFLSLSLLPYLNLTGCGQGGLTEVGVVMGPLCVILPLSTSTTDSTQDFCGFPTNTGNQVLDWEVLGGDNNGILSKASTTGGSDVIVYTAPTALPSDCVVQIQASSAADPTASNIVSVLLGDSTVCPPPSPSQGGTPVNCVQGPVAPTCPPPQ